jgi:hypothetical protein
MVSEECRVPNFRPEAGEYDRTLVLLEIDHPLWPLYRRMQQRRAILQRGLVEATLKGILEEPDVGYRLGRHGLAVVRADAAGVELAPTSPRLAILVNGLRYHTPPRGLLSVTLVQTALDLRCRPRRLSAEARLRAAEVLEGLAVDAASLLDMTEYARPRSLWAFRTAIEVSPPPWIPF